jgi:acyl carrier protein
MASFGPEGILMFEQTEYVDRVNHVVATVMGDRGLSPPQERGGDLFAAGLSSMGMVALMLAIESEFDFTIPNADLVPDNFRSVDAVRSMLVRLGGSPN